MLSCSVSFPAPDRRPVLSVHGESAQGGEEACHFGGPRKGTRPGGGAHRGAGRKGGGAGSGGSAGCFRAETKNGAGHVDRRRRPESLRGEALAAGEAPQRRFADFEADL